MNVMSKFDYDQDGVISMDDLKNIILTYVDSHFFDDKKQINHNILVKNNKQKYDENKRFYLVIKDALNKIKLIHKIVIITNLFFFISFPPFKNIFYPIYLIQLPSSLLQMSFKSFVTQRMHTFCLYRERQSVLI